MRSIPEADDERHLRLIRDGERVTAHPIPDGLTIERDLSTGEPKGLLAFWWTVPLARVDHDAATGEIVVSVYVDKQDETPFISEGVGTLNGWLAVAMPDDVKAALGEL